MGLADFGDKIDPAGAALREKGSNDFGKKTPGTPDMIGAAEATAKSNERINTSQTYANRPNVKTPWGSQSWTPKESIDPATGEKVTTWEQTQSLDPRQQQALDSQMGMQAGRSQLAEGMMGRLNDAYGSEFDWNSLPEMGGSVQTREMMGDSTAYRQRAQDAVDELNAPMLEERREGMNARLAAQGITPGSAAYNTEMRNLSDGENRAHLMAIQAGRDEAGQMFNQDLASNQQGFQQDMLGANRQDSIRQQMLAEALQARGMPLAEINAIMAGQGVGDPNLSSGVGGTAGKYQGADYGAAMGQQYNADLAAANASNQQKAGTVGALGSAAMMAMMMY